MKSKLKRMVKNNNLLNNIWRKIDWINTKHQINKDARIIPNKIYKDVFGKDINWNNPTTLIEKIYWLQLYSDTSLWTKCADKYKVREYVKEKGCAGSLNTLYGKWDKAEDIDWDKLPNSFVLKTNNSCGGVLLVQDKSLLNISKTITTLNNWLKLKYGYRDSQFHYTQIKPCIIAEKLFENEQDKSKSLVDYKIWCFNGVPEVVLVVFDRTKGGYSLASYDIEWNNISHKTFNLNDKYYRDVEFPKPNSLDEMIEYAKKLSKGIPQVRMDFYDINGKAVFGEMTFSTGYGYYSNDYYNYLGSKIDLSKIEKLEKPNNPFEI